VVFLPPQTVFEVLPHPIFVFFQFVGVGDLDSGGPVLVQPIVDGFTEELLSRDLDLSRRVVLDTRHLHHALAAWRSVVVHYI